MSFAIVLMVSDVLRPVAVVLLETVFKAAITHDGLTSIVACGGTLGWAIALRLFIARHRSTPLSQSRRA
ncbi:hypothetical protein C7B82_17840 [Stenomitos frigidus ULC18]|uniref:Uncharacterized protein n=1 Tax=Stenomitos frigidus ULC18 TaxID=2107698 RepID=A0A2T1E2P6_9CYAN|nr:hypothetical protein C7B82_17840 [Stenomitos frigidus ULC18]